MRLRSPSGLRIAAEEDHVVVQGGSKRWDPGLPDALAAYERALPAAPDRADGHFHAAGLRGRMGRHADAPRHRKAYRALTSPA